MQNDPENRQSSSPKSLGAILNQSPLQPTSASTSNLSSENSQTTTSLMENLSLIGKPLSETGLAMLRNIAQSVSSGKLMDDQALETLLAQHFGLSRFASKAKVDHVYAKDGGYEPVVQGHEIILDALHDAEMKLFDALEYLNRRAPYEFVAKTLARLRMVMARPSESNQDTTVVIDTYAEHLAEYPPDVVKAVCDKIIDTKKWFPLVSDIRKEAEALVSFRRAVWNKFQELRNPLLAAKAEAKKIAADPRLGVHWKVLPKKDWLLQHYEWALSEVEGFLRLAEQNPTCMDLPFWQAEAVRRKAERDTASMGGVNPPEPTATPMAQTG